MATVAERWPDHAAPEVRLLPSVLRSADLPALETHRGYALGLDEDFDPVYWSPRADQHLLIFGEEQSGKTTLLANLLRQISARSGTDQARFVIFDGRRQLLDLDYRPDQVIASATTAQDAANVVSANLDRLHRRMPAATASAAEISRRAWWGSPADIFLVVDDYERFAGSNPLVPLLPLLDHAADIGLHLIIARQARGAGRAMYDGVYTRLRDTGSPAVVLSAPESEGVIYGKTRCPAPACGTGGLGAPPRPGSDHPDNGGLRDRRWNLNSTSMTAAAADNHHGAKQTIAQGVCPRPRSPRSRTRPGCCRCALVAPPLRPRVRRQPPLVGTHWRDYYRHPRPCTVRSPDRVAGASPDCARRVGVPSAASISVWFWRDARAPGRPPEF